MGAQASHVSRGYRQMRMFTHKKRLLGCAGLLVAIFLLWTPAQRIIWAARVAFALRQLASGVELQNPDMTETKVLRQDGAKTYEALCYSPTRSAARSAVIIAAGLSEQGCYHPSLMALSRILADKGLLVVTPDIREFREFQISADPIDQIAFWRQQIPSLEGGEKIRKAGLAGVSYSGTLAIIAAARPELRDHIDFVLTIGPYFDLLRCTKEWFAAGDPKEDARYYPNYPTRFYARWLLMRASLELLHSPEDRSFLDQALNALLISQEVLPAPPDLTPEGRRWYEFALMRSGKTDAELADMIERQLTATLYARLDPSDALKQLRCPLFMVHGAYDDLIPVRESLALQERVPGSHLLISPFITHTHPSAEPLSFRQKLSAVREMLVFCYRLSVAIQD